MLVEKTHPAGDTETLPAADREVQHLDCITEGDDLFLQRIPDSESILLGLLVRAEPLRPDAFPALMTIPPGSALPRWYLLRSTQTKTWREANLYTGFE